jgi:hypothetical protein
MNTKIIFSKINQMSLFSSNRSDSCQICYNIKQSEQSIKILLQKQLEEQKLLGQTQRSAQTSLKHNGGSSSDLYNG